MGVLPGIWNGAGQCGPHAQQPPARPKAAEAVSVIRAGHLIDVISGRSLASQTIIIRGTKIEAIGSNLAIPDGAQVIDLSDMTVLPGLIDCHTHLADLGGNNAGEPLDVLRYSAAEAAYMAIPNARATLLSGFTTVRDVGVYRAFNDVAMRDAIAKGTIIGPRMYVAGAYVTISEGAGAMTGLAPDIELPKDLRFGIANSPWEVREKIRELAHRGADHIKVLSTGAVLTHGSNPKSIEFTPEELRAAVEEAAAFRAACRSTRACGRRHQECDPRRRGIGRARHVDRRRRHRARQRARDLPRHGHLRRRMHSSPRRRHPPDLPGARSGSGGHSTAQLHQGSEGRCQNRVSGTRCRSLPIRCSAQAIRLCMVQYGMTPMRAIQAATVNAADLIGHSRTVRLSLTAGKSADIVAVSGDPLADIHTLEHVKFVMKEGQVFKERD